MTAEPRRRWCTQRSQAPTGRPVSPDSDGFELAPAATVKYVYPQSHLLPVQFEPSIKFQHLPRWQPAGRRVGGPSVLFQVAWRSIDYVVHISRPSGRRCLQLGRPEVKIVIGDDDDGWRW